MSCLQRKDLMFVPESMKQWIDGHIWQKAEKRKKLDDLRVFSSESSSLYKFRLLSLSLSGFVLRLLDMCKDWLWWLLNFKRSFWSGKYGQIWQKVEKRKKGRWFQSIFIRELIFVQNLLCSSFILLRVDVCKDLDKSSSQSLHRSHCLCTVMVSLWCYCHATPMIRIVKSFQFWSFETIAKLISK